MSNRQQSESDNRGVCRERFLEQILHLESEKQSHYSVMTRDFYNKLLAEIEEAKSTVKKTPLQYRRLKRFNVLEVRETKKLVSRSEPVKYYLSVDEIFDVIESTHVAIGHAGRDRLKTETSRTYANITTEMINVFLAMCETCQRKKNKKIKAVEERHVEVKTEMPDIHDMLAGPSSVDTFVELYPPRNRPSEWTVPQQAPPGTKLVVPPAPPPLKKSLPPTPQPSPKPAIVKPAPARPVSPPQPPPPPPEVCLRWNSYHSNMQATFPSLLNNEQFVDVTLACEGRSIKCHKMMLSACSSYFEELLSQNPCQHPIVLMKDLKFWEVQALVDFMYRGEVNVGQDKLPSLLAAAEALQIKGLAGPASTTSSHDEDSLPPSLPLAAEDYLDESASSPSGARRARKRRTLATMATPQQNTVTPLRNQMGRPRLVRPSPQPSTSSYVASEPPLRRPRKSEPSSLPVGEIKMEPVDIDISNDSVGNDSMDPINESFDMKKSFEDTDGTGEGNDSSRLMDEAGEGGGGKGEDHEMTGSICDDNSALLTGHDSDLDYGNNNGMTSEQADSGATDDQNSEIQGYTYTEGSDDGGPGMSSSDINPSYPEVVLNPDNASSDSILGHV